MPVINEGLEIRAVILGNNKIDFIEGAASTGSLKRASSQDVKNNIKSSKSNMNSSVKSLPAGRVNSNNVLGSPQEKTEQPSGEPIVEDGESQAESSAATNVETV